MSADPATFQLIASRPAPGSRRGIVELLRRNLFDGWGNTLATLLVLAVLAWLLPPLLRWGVVEAVFRPDNAACRAAAEIGACWGVVGEKGRLIIFGRYPYAEQWRPLLACGLLVALLVASCLKLFWRRWLILLWVVVLALFVGLMRGGMAGLIRVTSRPCDPRNG